MPKKNDIEAKFNRIKCVVQFGYFANGDVAIRLFDKDTGEPVARATVCLEHATAGKGYVFVKDWAENEGVLNALMDAKIVGPSIDRYPTGYAAADLCKLLVNPETGLPVEESTTRQPVSA